MKTLKFTTSKGDFALMDGKEQIDQTLKPLLDEYTPVAKVSEMSEEQFVEVVDSTETHPKYWNYNLSYFREFHAKESFESLVRSLGWYLWENPLQITAPSWDVTLYDNIEDMKACHVRWQEAESKTLYNPILLKKI